MKSTLQRCSVSCVSIQTFVTTDNGLCHYLLILNRKDNGTKYWHSLIITMGDSVALPRQRWRSDGLIVWKMKKYFVESRKKGIPYVKQKEGRLIGLVISCRNCLLKHFIEEKIQGKVEVMGRWGGRRKQPLDDLKERRKDTGKWKRKH